MTPRQYVEIFHLVFLKHLESKLDKNLFALKGGCNLRFFFRSIRYSEDIDFDVRVIAKGTLQNKINKLLEAQPLLQTLKSKGIELQNISEPKQSETTQRWKIGLKVLGSTLLLPTKIEFSRRAMTEEVLFEPIDTEIIHGYKLYPILTNHYILQAAFNQKVSALIHRTETQARDIFDLKLLISQGATIKKLPADLKSKIDQAINNLSNINFSEFKGHVVAYLSQEYQDYYDSLKQWKEIQSDVTHELLSDKDENN